MKINDWVKVIGKDDNGLIERIGRTGKITTLFDAQDYVDMGIKAPLLSPDTVHFYVFFEAHITSLVGGRTVLPGGAWFPASSLEFANPPSWADAHADF